MYFICLCCPPIGPTTGVVLGWLAQHSWGYGYWGPFLLDFEVRRVSL